MQSGLCNKEIKVGSSAEERRKKDLLYGEI